MLAAAATALLLAFVVPPEIGPPVTPKGTPATGLPPNLADAAVESRSKADTIATTAEATRAFNIDFVPRVGWKGTVFPSVASPVLASIFVSLSVVFLHDQFGFRGIDPIAHTVLGVLVSFLTVFRTQQAYNRYWEGRGHLGLMMATIVDTASVASVQFSAERPEEATAARTELARLMRLYFKETVRFLRRTSRTTQRVSNYWLPQEAIVVPEADEIVCDADATSGECEALYAVARYRHPPRKLTMPCTTIGASCAALHHSGSPRWLCVRCSAHACRARTCLRAAHQTSCSSGSARTSIASVSRARWWRGRRRASVGAPSPSASTRTSPTSSRASTAAPRSRRRPRRSPTPKWADGSSFGLHTRSPLPSCVHGIPTRAPYTVAPPLGFASADHT